ncbi:SE1561 family protein [Paraliobacillus sp. JSM ZJ581]|uniref:SE1561 family protein n=1 Tax=Paraliobacillus sp. JSM ZJ581 TaxID=3342118 RepID=UPI0035A8B4F2
MVQEAKMSQLKAQLQTFLVQLDQLDPNHASVEDVDQLLELIEKMEQALQTK